jgi:HNH endonuclease
MRQREILHQTSRLVPCQCKCGELIKEYTKHGKKARFKYGHHLRKERNPNWIGGKHKSCEGYIRERIGNNEYYQQHRLIWELSNNCCLLPNILIHHKNGIKDDNRIENLEPLTPKQHKFYHPSPEETLFKIGYKRFNIQN